MFINNFKCEDVKYEDVKNEDLPIKLNEFFKK